MKKLFALSLTLGALSGCAVAPSVPILGAFFPAWLLCIAGALCITLPLRAVLIRRGLDRRLGPPLLVYPLLTIIGTLLFWILFFRN